MQETEETQVWALGWEDPLENAMDRGAWQATVHGVAKSRTWQKQSSFCQKLFEAYLQVDPVRVRTVLGLGRILHCYWGGVWLLELDHKAGWVPKNWCFQTVVLEKTLQIPLDCKEIKPVNPKGDQSLEGLMLKLKFQHFGHLMWRADSLERPCAGKDWGQEKREAEDEKVGWHHWLNGHETEQTPGRWCRTRKPDPLWSMGSQRAGHDLATEQVRGCFSEPFTQHPMDCQVFPLQKAGTQMLLGHPCSKDCATCSFQ